MGLLNRYPRETVNPSFEPQPPSLMLKIRFLKRSRRKYEKNCSYGHGVSGGLAKKICVERVHLRTLPVFFWQGILRKIAKNASKNGLKSLQISISGMGLNPGIFAGLKIP